MSHTPQRTPQRTLGALSALAVLALAPMAAWAADTAIPNAGSILQQIQPPAPVPPSGSTGLAIEPGRAGALPDSAPFEIKRLQISGNTRFDTATLHARVAQGEGQRMTLRELDTLIQRITEHYRLAGYPLARAIIPVQTIREGVVRIEVIEARYGRVLLDNQSRVRSGLLQDTLAALQPGAVVSQAELDRALLLLSDIPGMELGALLRPGEAVGSSDLLVNAVAGARLNGYASADNNGNRFTGRTRAGAGLNYLNALGRGDVASVGVMSSGERVNYARLGYELQLGGLGTRAGAAWSWLDYRLGGSATDLLAHGNARVGSAWVTHPWVRSAALNLRSELEYEQLGLQDRVDASSIRNDRQVRKVSLTLSGEALSAQAGGMAHAWRLTLSGGQVGFGDTAAALADEATARTRGRFMLSRLYLAHTHNLGANAVLAVVLNAQQGTRNLDPSQKFLLSGPFAVRAYDAGEAQGDAGYTLSAELRQSLNALGVGTGLDQWQAVVFAETGHVRVNRRPWAAGANGVTMTGVGLGLNWSGPDQWSARLWVAAPVRTLPEGASGQVRGGASLSKGF